MLLPYDLGLFIFQGVDLSGNQCQSKEACFMSKRRRLLLGLVLVAFAAIVGHLAFWQPAPRHRINDQSVKSIQKGMTLEKVESIFGGPPGDYSQKNLLSKFSYVYGVYNSPKGNDLKRWIGDKMIVVVLFDKSGRVNMCGIECRSGFFIVSFLADISRLLGL